MRVKFRLTVLLLTICLLNNKSEAQVDPHFSQYYVYPSWLNPALTGAFDGDYRISGIYRTQWGNVSSPYKTYGLSADFTTAKNINFGASLLQQSAGDGGYEYTTAYGNVAYTGVKFGSNGFQRLTFGIQGGIVQRRFDPSKMTFGDMWNPVTGLPTNPTTDFIDHKSDVVFDAGAGVLFFDAAPGKKANFFGGYSASHLTRPEDDFKAYGESRLPVRHTVHAGIRLAVSPEFSITPNALFLSQGTATEKMIGAYGQVKAGANAEFLVGANYRFEDAISPYVGFGYKNWVLGASYDVNTSDLGKMVNGANAFEISLSFVGKRSVKTPEAEFVCPRL